MFSNLLSWSMYWKNWNHVVMRTPPPLPPFTCLEGVGVGDTWGKWKYQAGCGEVGVTSTLCSSTQKQALHQMAVLPVLMSAFSVLCNASGRLGIRWQFCPQQHIWHCRWCQAATSGSVTPSQWHLAQNWTAEMQPGILCSEKQKWHKTEGPRPIPLVVEWKGNVTTSSPEGS